MHGSRTLSPLLLLGLLAPGPAAATAPELYGLGARSMGSGGGGVAMVEDGNAALVNPAGLGRIRQPQAGIGFTGAFPRFDPVPALWWDTNRDGSLDERDPPLEWDVDVDDHAGFHLFHGRQVGGKFGIGIAAYMPAQRILRFSTFEPDLPHYFMYANRQQRYVLGVGLGGEIVKGVSIGASIDFVPSARYTLYLTANTSVVAEGEEQEGVEELVGDIELDVHEMHLELVPDFAPVLGVQVEVGKWVPKLEGLVLAAAWRGEVGLPITVDIDAQVNLSVEDLGDLEPLIFSILLDAGLFLNDHYVPSTLTFGAAWRTQDTLSAYIDVKRTDWRGMQLNVARIQSMDVSSPLIDLSDFVSDGNEFDFSLVPTWSYRMGSELRLPEWALESKFRYLRGVVRGGVGHEPSPLVGQGPNSALLDADRTMFTLGGGIEFWDPLALVDAPVRLDVYTQYHVLARDTLDREAHEPKAGYPVQGGVLPIGGSIFVIGGQWGFDF